MPRAFDGWMNKRCEFGDFPGATSMPLFLRAASLATRREKQDLFFRRLCTALCSHPPGYGRCACGAATVVTCTPSARVTWWIQTNRANIRCFTGLTWTINLFLLHPLTALFFSFFQLFFRSSWNVNYVCTRHVSLPSVRNKWLLLFWWQK